MTTVMANTKVVNRETLDLSFSSHVLTVHSPHEREVLYHVGRTQIEKRQGDALVSVVTLSMNAHS